MRRSRVRRGVAGGSASRWGTCGCALLLAACAGTPPRDAAAEAPAAAPRSAHVSEPVRLAAPVDAGAESGLDAGPRATELDASPAAAAGPADSATDEAPADEVPPLPPKGKRYRPLGACVDPLEHAKRLMSGPGSHGKATDFVPEPYLGGQGDLDGDGEPDQLLVGNVANITTTYYVYVMRGKCGHFAGRIDAVGNMQPVGGYTHGLRGLGGLAPCQPQCCKTLTYSEYRYDGARFKLAKKELREVSDCALGGGI